MGKVGTGWSRTVSSEIRKKLDTVISPKSKLTKPLRKPKATWVEPTFYAEHHVRRTAARQFVQRTEQRNARFLNAFPPVKVEEAVSDNERRLLLLVLDVGTALAMSGIVVSVLKLVADLA
jgi:ATP-dependent DNA ligase